jgi:hypothetical protein
MLDGTMGFCEGTRWQANEARRRAGGGQAGWRVASCWLITVETPSPRMVMP